MVYLFITVGVLILGLLIGAIRASREARLKLRDKLINGYGKISEQEYSVERFRSLGFYFRSQEKTPCDIDDITVNDTDLDELFMYLNNTCSAMGEEYLYSILRKPASKKEVLEAREKVIEFFDSHPEERLKIQFMLSKVGKIKQISLYEYIHNLNNAPVENNMMHYLVLLLYPASFLAMLLNIPFGIFMLVGTVGYSIISYFKSKASKEIYYTVILIVLGTIKLADELKAFDADELKPYIKAITDASDKLSPMNRFSFILTSKGNNLIDVLLDYVRMLTHLDLIKFNNIITTYRDNTDALNTIFLNYGFLDAMISIASFRKWLPDYSIPEFVDKAGSIEVENLYHPLIKDPVRNSISTNKCVLLTGSNASGKSTFIKSLAINTILAQTINTSLSTSYRAPFFKVISSMALRDNLTGGESYYIVEIKSLKRILDSAGDDIAVLCFVDEVLRGTNTLERIAASSEILKNLSDNGCMCFAATHDLELADILTESYQSYHFSEKLTENDVEFDYKLKPGKATSRNAIKLLAKLGYPSELTEAAEEAALTFERTGNWGFDR